jgi:hypothetical protein
VFALALGCWRARIGEAGYRNKPLVDIGAAPEGFRPMGDPWRAGSEGARAKK